MNLKKAKMIRKAIKEYLPGGKDNPNFRKMYLYVKRGLELAHRGRK